MCPTCMVLTDSHHVPTTDTLTGNSSKITKNIWNDNFFSEGCGISCRLNFNLHKLELLPFFLRHIYRSHPDFIAPQYNKIPSASL